MPKSRFGNWQFWLLSIGLIVLLGTALKVFTMVQQAPRSSKLAMTKLALEHQPTLASGADRQPLTTDEIYQRVNPAVVTIYTAQGVGSGSIVRSDGLVLTNRHVVQNAPEVKLKTANGESFVGKVIDLDLRYDLALVQLRGHSLHLPTVTFASASQLKLGDPVFAIGSPAGKSGVFTTGTFTQLTQHGSLQTSAGLLSEGNSGGPLLNRQGEVIGINKGVLNDRSGLATRIEAAKALIQRNDVIYKRQNSTIQS